MRPGPVEPPTGTVRQDAPAHLAGGHVVDAAEVAQHLRRWGQPLAAPPRTTIRGRSHRWTRRRPDRARSALHSSAKRLARSLAASSAKRRPSGTSWRPTGERFCCLRWAVQPIRLKTGQIRSSSVWLSLGVRSVGKRSNRARSAASRSSRADVGTPSQSGSSVIASRRKPRRTGSLGRAGSSPPATRES